MNYTISQWLDHMEQARCDACSWNSGSFRTTREQQAFEAGFKDGGNQSKNLISLHGGFKLSDPRIGGNAAITG
jgi:hypothetical protein